MIIRAAGFALNGFGAALLGILTLAPPASAEPTFVGPAGWSHVDQSNPSDTTRKIDQWHLSGDVQSVTFIKDSSTSFNDALAAIQKNFTDNHVKATVNKDATCQGRAGHVVEFATGPDGHRIVINRVLFPDGNGVDSITYARSEGSPFDDEVKKSITAFCGPS